MYKTCRDIENSLYIAPNEIRSCCQRFFHKGKIRGDAKLIKIKEGKTPTIKDLVEARKKILDEIQNDKNEDCLGCPFITSQETKPKATGNVSYLSIEHHSVCNLRCNYCSEVYWGGKKSKYNVVDFITYLSKGRALDKCDQVVWGGGEPTLDKSFDQIFENIHKYASPNIYHRVFTNSVRYSDTVEKFLKKGLIKITTSIDAGTPETFKFVRGRPKFFNVFENLSRYAKVDPKKIIIKYIFTEDNKEESELDSFVKNCLVHELQNCNYQISINYKKENFDLKFLKSILYLFSKLNNSNIKKVFIDDHIMLRFSSLNFKEEKEIIEYLKSKNSSNIILNPDEIKNLIVFGAGKIATEIVKKTNFFRKIENFDLVDSDINKVGKKILNSEIKSPQILKNDSRKIFIASAECYDEIHNYIKNLKGNTNSILNGIII